jgi:general secretion pathway protein D
MRARRRARRVHARLVAALLLSLAPAAAAQEVAPGASPATSADGQRLVNLDFEDQELAVVIKQISDMTGKNFIYDDRVRGRVTIVSPTPIPVDQAYAVFESVLQVKGFTTVTTPGGAIKVIPLRDAKETNVDTRESYQAPPDRDHIVTRLIPLRYVDADSIVNTIKPLVSKDAAIAAYVPTNTVILTESASNIRRIMAILEAVDVETHKAEIAVIRLDYADAATLAEQLAEIYGAEAVTPTAPGAGRPRRAARAQPEVSPTVPGARIQVITDERTNSLVVLASRVQLEEIRGVIAMLDVPISGGGRIHVYYLKHANAEELAQTLSGLLTGGSRTGAAQPAGQGGGQAEALRATVAELAGGITITADPATNSLVIQATQEGFATLVAVIRQLDVPRPQVLVEALIMEVAVTNSDDLGFDGIWQAINGDTQITFRSLTDTQAAAIAAGATGGPMGILAQNLASGFLGAFKRDTRDKDAQGNPTGNGTLIQSIIRASKADAGTNIISAPHILTSDNEQAEIRVGNNIPIISSRVESAAGQDIGLSTSVNVERQDIGVTLRVTPQITEGETLRLDIFQEISAINRGLAEDTGNAEDVGVPLSTRRVENVVVVSDGETVVIGGLISDDYQDIQTKVPWFGDIPIFGWAFKSSTRVLRKNNLLVFLTPHIVRTRADLEKETIRKREEFRRRTGEQLELSQDEREELEAKRQAAEAAGLPFEPDLGRNPVRVAVLEHETRYPLQRMREIEQGEREEAERAAQERAEQERAPSYWVQAAVVGDEADAQRALTALIDAGYDGSLVSVAAGGAVIHEIRLGPYARLEDAQQAGAAVERSHGLKSAVLVEPAEP